MSCIGARSILIDKSGVLSVIGSANHGLFPEHFWPEKEISSLKKEISKPRDEGHTLSIVGPSASSLD